jgi:type IV secretory pathway VirJ component
MSAGNALSQASTTDDRPLPTVEVPATTGTRLALFWSGDGGWAELSSQVARDLADSGIAVVGINSRRWLGGSPRSPEEAAHDTERLLRDYLARWHRDRVVLIGYSRGAGFLPFVVSRLPADLRARIDLVAMLGAEHATSFEFHLTDLVMSTPRRTDLPALPEIARSPDLHWFCLYGTREGDTICPSMDRAKTTVVARVGDHHFDRDYAGIAGDILRALARPIRPGASPE